MDLSGFVARARRSSLYAVLGALPGSDADELRKAYRKACLQFHEFSVKELERSKPNKWS